MLNNTKVISTFALKLANTFVSVQKVSWLEAIALALESIKGVKGISDHTICGKEFWLVWWNDREWSLLSEESEVEALCLELGCDIGCLKLE